MGRSSHRKTIKSKGKLTQVWQEYFGRKTQWVFKVTFVSHSLLLVQSRNFNKNCKNILFLLTL